MSADGHTGTDVLQMNEEVSGMGFEEIRRLKQLEEENRKHKRLVADLSQDKTMLLDVLRRKWWSALAAGTS